MPLHDLDAGERLDAESETVALSPVLCFVGLDVDLVTRPLRKWRSGL